MKYSVYKLSDNFDLSQYKNTRFMYNPDNKEIILGSFHDSVENGSHATMFYDAKEGTNTGYDDYNIKGWIGFGGRKYQKGVIHFAPNVRPEEYEKVDACIMLIERLKKHGFTDNTWVRGLVRFDEYKVKDMYEKIQNWEEDVKPYKEQLKDWVNCSFVKDKVYKIAEGVYTSDELKARYHNSDLKPYFLLIDSPFYSNGKLTESFSNLSQKGFNGIIQGKTFRVFNESEQVKEADAQKDAEHRDRAKLVFDSIAQTIKKKPNVGHLVSSRIQGFGYFMNITQGIEKFYPDIKSDKKLYLLIRDDEGQEKGSFRRFDGYNMITLNILSDNIMTKLANSLSEPKVKQNRLIKEYVWAAFMNEENTFLHEFTHAIDEYRLKNYKGRKVSQEKQTTVDYLNDPLEFNAWFQSNIQEFDGIQTFEKEFGKDWNLFYGFVLNSLPFVKEYNEKYRRKFDVRLWKYWNEFIKEGSDKKQVNESLKNEGGFFITNSGQDILNLLQNKTKEYRIVYDANLNLFMICDANEGIHQDMLEKAYNNGLYYNLEKFIDSLGTFQNYIETGQDGGWDENDEEIESYLYYMVFDPTGQWQVGDDGYDTIYKLPYGNLLTRKCDLSEIPFYDMLPLTEQLNEGVNTQYLYHAMWKKQFLRCKKDNRLYSHIAYENYKTAHRTIKGISTSRNVDVCIKFMERAIKEMTDEWKKDPTSYFTMNDTGNDGTTHYIDKGADLSYVVLVFDREKLKQNHKIIPHSYIGGQMRDTFGDEQEELIVGDLPNFMDYVVDVMEFNNNINSKTLKSKKNLHEGAEPKLNDNFWKWFGNSKTIKNGKPIIYYHRTNAEFDTFSKDYNDGLLVSGFYFSEKPLSDWYGKNIKECYLKMENPYIIENMDNINDIEKFVKTFGLFKKKWQLKDIKSALKEYSEARCMDRTKEFDGKSALRSLVKWDFDDQTSKITNIVKNRGYDSLIFKNSNGKDGIVFDEYIVFEPNQIKSVNNNGNWSLTSDNINEVKEPNLNQNFWKWFGDSVCVDDTGAPLVLYHGTSSEFNKFKKGLIFTTDNEQVADGYGYYGAMPVFVRIRKPFIVDAFNQDWQEIYNAEGFKKKYKDLTDEDIEKLYKAYEYFESLEDAKQYYEESKKYNPDDYINLARAYGQKPHSTNEWAQYAKNKGYDGCIIKNVVDGFSLSDCINPINEYIVWNPEQVKSVNNNGEWSESDELLENARQLTFYKDVYVIDSPQSLIRYLQNTKPYDLTKILYDRNKNFYIVGNGDTSIHIDLLIKAANEGWYDGLIENPKDDNDIDYYWDLQLRKDNLQPFSFSKEENVLGDDGNEYQIKYDFGSFFTKVEWLPTDLANYIGNGEIIENQNELMESLDTRKITVYHGSSDKDLKIKDNSTIFFTNSKEDAERWAKRILLGGKKNNENYIYKAEITFNKPYIIGDSDANPEYNKFKDIENEKEKKDIYVEIFFDDIVNNYKEFVAKGYDCFIDNMIGNGITYYVIPSEFKNNVKWLEVEKI